MHCQRLLHPLTKAQVALPLEWTLVSSPCCKQIDNCHGISAAWPYFSYVLKKFHLRDILIIVVEFAFLSKAHSIRIQIILWHDSLVDIV